MKKIIVSIFLLLLVFILASCKKDSNDTLSGTKIDASIVSSELDDNLYTYEIMLNKDYPSEDLDEIFNELSRAVYETLISEVGTNKYLLNIEFSNSNKDYGQMMLVINESITNPGLKLLVDNTNK